MNKPTFFEGVAVALATSLGGGALQGALATILPAAPGLRLVVPVIGLAYVVYLLARSRERVGRVTAFLAWALIASVVWLLEPPLSLYLLVHLALIWLIRSLFFHSGVLSALLDLGLSILALAAALWAATQSGSLFLSLWSFFLVQALFVAIPARLPRKATPGRGEPPHEDRFRRSQRAAQSALQRLSVSR